MVYNKPGQFIEEGGRKFFIGKTETVNSLPYRGLEATIYEIETYDDEGEQEISFYCICKIPKDPKTKAEIKERMKKEEGFPKSLEVDGSAVLILGVDDFC